MTAWAKRQDDKPNIKPVTGSPGFGIVPASQLNTTYRLDVIYVAQMQQPRSLFFSRLWKQYFAIA